MSLNHYATAGAAGGAAGRFHAGPAARPVMAEMPVIGDGAVQHFDLPPVDDVSVSDSFISNVNIHGMSSSTAYILCLSALRVAHAGNSPRCTCAISRGKNLGALSSSNREGN